jgi:mono/diheme cytochrome c family protein
MKLPAYLFCIAAAVAVIPLARADELNARATPSGQMPSGQEVFQRHCVHCHGPGSDAVGTLQLARTRGQDKALLTERKDLPPEYIRIVVRHGLRAMPAFVPSDLTDAQLEALTDFLTSRK